MICCLALLNSVRYAKLIDYSFVIKHYVNILASDTVLCDKQFLTTRKTFVTLKLDGTDLLPFIGHDLHPFGASDQKKAPEDTITFIKLRPLSAGTVLRPFPVVAIMIANAQADLLPH